MLIDPGIERLREGTSHEEIDYGYVMDRLKIYKNPRKKLNYLLKNKALIRIKKGLYIFGKPFARAPYCPEVLANLIYGPSYVSLEWACQYHRLIPEQVVHVTSVTTKRSKHFDTPVGTYFYEHIPLKAFPVGVELIRFSPIQQALMATKEKALADLLVYRRGKYSSMKQFKETLHADLRIEEEDIRALDLPLLSEIAIAFPHSAIQYLIKYRESCTM